MEEENKTPEEGEKVEEELGGEREEKPSEEKDKEWNKDNENTGTGEDLREADTTTSDEE